MEGVVNLSSDTWAYIFMLLLNDPKVDVDHMWNILFSQVLFNRSFIAGRNKPYVKEKLMRLTHPGFIGDMNQAEIVKLVHDVCQFNKSRKELTRSIINVAAHLRMKGIPFYGLWLAEKLFLKRSIWNKSIKKWQSPGAAFNAIRTQISVLDTVAHVIEFPPKPHLLYNGEFKDFSQFQDFSHVKFPDPVVEVNLLGIHAQEFFSAVRVGMMMAIGVKCSSQYVGFLFGPKTPCVICSNTTERTMNVKSFGIIKSILSEMVKLCCSSCALMYMMATDNTSCLKIKILPGPTIVCDNDVIICHNDIKMPLLERNCRKRCLELVDPDTGSVELTNEGLTYLLSIGPSKKFRNQVLSIYQRSLQSKKDEEESIEEMISEDEEE